MAENTPTPKVGKIMYNGQTYDLTDDVYNSLKGNINSGRRKVAGKLNELLDLGAQEGNTLVYNSGNNRLYVTDASGKTIADEQGDWGNRTGAAAKMGEFFNSYKNDFNVATHDMMSAFKRPTTNNITASAFDKDLERNTYVADRIDLKKATYTDDNGKKVTGYVPTDMNMVRANNRLNDVLNYYKDPNAWKTSNRFADVNLQKYLESDQMKNYDWNGLSQRLATGQINDVDWQVLNAVNVFNGATPTTTTTTGTTDDGTVTERGPRRVTVSNGGNGRGVTVNYDPDRKILIDDNGNPLATFNFNTHYLGRAADADPFTLANYAQDGNVYTYYDDYSGYDDASKTWALARLDDKGNVVYDYFKKGDNGYEQADPITLQQMGNLETIDRLQGTIVGPDNQEFGRMTQNGRAIEYNGDNAVFHVAPTNAGGILVNYVDNDGSQKQVLLKNTTDFSTKYGAFYKQLMDRINNPNLVTPGNYRQYLLNNLADWRTADYLSLDGPRTYIHMRRGKKASDPKTVEEVRAKYNARPAEEKGLEFEQWLEKHGYVVASNKHGGILYAKMGSSFGAQAINPERTIVINDRVAVDPSRQKWINGLRTAGTATSTASALASLPGGVMGTVGLIGGTLGDTAILVADLLDPNIKAGKAIGRYAGNMALNAGAVAGTSALKLAKTGKEGIAAAKAIKGAKNIGEAIKTADNATDAIKVADQFTDVLKNADKLGDLNKGKDATKASIETITKAKAEVEKLAKETPKLEKAVKTAEEKKNANKITAATNELTKHKAALATKIEDLATATEKAIQDTNKAIDWGKVNSARALNVVQQASRIGTGVASTVGTGIAGVQLGRDVANEGFTNENINRAILLGANTVLGVGNVARARRTANTTSFNADSNAGKIKNLAGRAGNWGANVGKRTGATLKGFGYYQPKTTTWFDSAWLNKTPSTWFGKATNGVVAPVAPWQILREDHNKRVTYYSPYFKNGGTLGEAKRIVKSQKGGTTMDYLKTLTGVQDSDDINLPAAIVSAYNTQRNVRNRWDKTLQGVYRGYNTEDDWNRLSDEINAANEFSGNRQEANRLIAAGSTGIDKWDDADYYKVFGHHKDQAEGDTDSKAFTDYYNRQQAFLRSHNQNMDLLTRDHAADRKLWNDYNNLTAQQKAFDYDLYADAVNSDKFGRKYINGNDNWLNRQAKNNNKYRGYGETREPINVNADDLFETLKYLQSQRATEESRKLMRDAEIKSANAALAAAPMRLTEPRYQDNGISRQQEMADAAFNEHARLMKELGSDQGLTTASLLSLAEKQNATNADIAGRESQNIAAYNEVVRNTKNAQSEMDKKEAEKDAGVYGQMLRSVANIDSTATNLHSNDLNNYLEYLKQSANNGRAAQIEQLNKEIIDIIQHPSVYGANAEAEIAKRKNRIEELSNRTNWLNPLSFGRYTNSPKK